MLSSDLTHFAFPAVLQMLMNGGRTGHVRVRGPLSGEVWLENGNVVHAVSMGKAGASALDLLASLNRGELQFEGGPTTSERTVTSSRDATLRQLLVDNAAWSPLLAALPDWDQGLRFTARWSEQQPVTRAQYRALAGVGRLTVRQMLETTDLPPRTLLGILLSFMQAGLVEAAPS
ncbi:DUF4388 domain-containing protein [Deinococcus sonorensis]|uniref:DUF4388 domain-containing protein n=2 Tax=Deinococcus sonorensis TaxID=309891 RepID=A0AAU7U9T2_9DEIO